MWGGESKMLLSLCVRVVLSLREARGDRKRWRLEALM